MQERITFLHGDLTVGNTRKKNVSIFFIIKMQALETNESIKRCMRRRDGDLCCLWWGEKGWIKQGEEEKGSRELHLDEIGLDIEYHELHLKYGWIWL